MAILHRRQWLLCDKRYSMLYTPFSDRLIDQLIDGIVLYAWVALTLSQTSPGFYVSAVQIFRKHCEKGEIAHNKHFFPFPTVFSTL